MSIYKRFRTPPSSLRDRPEGGDFLGSGRYALAPRFDQPSYLSFKLMFGEADAFYNNAASENYILNYDIMPHPLFQSPGNPDVFERQKYSAVSYLQDANEFTRAEMLKNFIQLWKKLQSEYQWYFQKIDGVSELLKIDPLKGQRVTSDKRLTITALEGVDLRLSHLMNLYRKIVWDDTYQRWVLPDMMRYFTLDIYITEFRTFHTPERFNTYGVPQVPNDSPDYIKENLRLNILDDILPVWKIRCEMCEFDIQTVEYDHLSSLGVDEAPGEAGVKFGIKVGKMYEEQIYPTFKNAFLVDKALNGFDRAKKEEINTSTVTGPAGSPVEISSPLPFDSTSPEGNSNETIRNNRTLLAVAQDQTYNPEDVQHISGAWYNQFTNTQGAFGVNNQEGYPLSLATQNEREEGGKNSWFSNAAEQGKAFLENKFEEVIDKAKITPIPGLGISFSEVQAALQGKNIITALGLLRKGVNNVVNQYANPSERLDQEIFVDEAFRAYLEGVAQSEATNEPEVSLVEAAKLALGDTASDGTSILDKVRDFSKATDLTGQGETNVPVGFSPESGIIQTAVNSQATTDPAVDPQTGIIQSTTQSEATGNPEVVPADLSEATASAINANINDELSGEEPTSEATTGNVEGGPINQEVAQSIATQRNPEGGAINPNVPQSEATEGKLEGGSLVQGGTTSQATSGSVSSEDLDGAESNINKKIPVGTIFEGVPTSQATTNKIQSE